MCIRDRPGGEASAARLVIVSVAVAMGALVASEWLARRVARRVTGREAGR